MAYDMGVVPRSEKMIRHNMDRMKFGTNKAGDYECRTHHQYDSLAARVAAPIWLLVWIMTAGKMGHGLWNVEILLTRSDFGRGPPPP